MRRIIVLLIVLVLAVSSIVTFLLVRTEPKKITVPDDYPTIQAAIDNATAGDTVFVRSGSYYTTPFIPILIDKPLSLIGENPTTVVIAETGTLSPTGRTIVEVSASDVTVTGFTIKGGDSGIRTRGDRCRIIRNNVMNNYNGLTIGGDEHIISENNITENSYGISAITTDSLISGNNIFRNSIGIIIDESKDVTISENSLTYNGYNADEISQNNGSLLLRWTGPFNVYGNTIEDNKGYGIMFGEGCGSSSVYGNNITRNSIGVDLLNFVIGEGLDKIGLGNAVWKNNFVNNSQQVLAEKTFFYARNYEDYAWGTNGTDVVSWDQCNKGNYWSDYKGSGLYIIDEENVDHYPLMQAVYVSTESSPPLSQQEPFPVLPVAAAFVFIIIMATAGLLVYFKKIKKK